MSCELGRQHEHVIPWPPQLMEEGLLLMLVVFV